MLFEFGLKMVPGEPPEGIPDGWVAMVAPRPLYGRQLQLVEGWGWAGQVVVDPTDEDQIRANAALDASVVLWVDRVEVINGLRETFTAEYGAEAVDAVDDDGVFAMWRPPSRMTLAVDRLREDA